MLPVEVRLLRQARSGDVNAFVELCIPAAEWVYRYIHFLVPNNRVAEGLTVQVFFKAWEQIDHYHLYGSPFVIWLYSIARVQVVEHHRTHKHSPAPDNAIILAARGDEFREEFQIIRDGLRVLPEDMKNTLTLKYIVGIPEKHIARLLNINTGEAAILQVNALCALSDHLNNSPSKTITKDFRHVLENCLGRLLSGASSLKECLLRYPQHSSQLEPVLQTALLLDLGHEVRPVPAFINYTQEVLAQSLRFRPRRSQITVSAPMVRRLAISFAMLTAAFLATGTAYAQSAMPGETMYGWKRASEQVWQTLAPHSIEVDVALAERRLDEWIVVENDPKLSADAGEEYQKALQHLGSNGNAENPAVIAVLQSQQEELANAGLSSPELNEYLNTVNVQLPEEAKPQNVPAVVLATPTVISASPEPAATEEVTNSCPPKCGNQNGNNSNNSNAGNNNAGGNAGGNSDNAKENNRGGNDEEKDKGEGTDKDKNK